MSTAQGLASTDVTVCFVAHQQGKARCAAPLRTLVSPSPPHSRATRVVTTAETTCDPAEQCGGIDVCRKGVQRAEEPINGLP